MFKKLSKYHFMSLLTAFVVVNNIVAVTFSLQTPYYIFMAVVLLYWIAKGGVNQIDKTFIFFFVAIVLSIVLNDIPSFFSPWMRFGTFAIVCLLVSPCIGSNVLYRFRCETFVLIQYLMILVTALSFLFYLRGINFMALAQGGQSGITTHSMLMGPIAANTLIFSMYKLMVERLWQKKDKSRYVFVVLCIISFILIFLSLSRTTLMASMIGLIVLTVLNARFRPGKTMKIVLGIFLILCATFPVWKNYADGMERKNEASIRVGSIISSREYHWNERIKEFKSSPFFGIGFASVGATGSFDVRSGKVETGSGWLSVLSMTGLAGLAGFVMIFYGCFSRVRQNVSKRFMPVYCLLGALLTFYAVHMLAEGYIFGAGNFLFFNVWLLIGTCSAAAQTKMNKVTL